VRRNDVAMKNNSWRNNLSLNKPIIMSINRRQLMQQLTTTVIGSALLPFLGHPNTLQTNTEGIYIAAGDGKKGKIGDMEMLFKLNKEQTGGHMGLAETIIQPGELGAPPHYHTYTDELTRVLEGAVFILTGETITELKAGDWHLRPKNVVHTFWNSSQQPAKTIDICLPGGHEAYLQELAALFENNNRPKPEDFKRLEQKHDIHYRFDLLKGIMEKYKVKL
jgi:mannose-6-phosphate isomerase-like protein (cupin superfamily)